MRIENSSIQLFGSSTSIEQNTKEESLKMWVGNRRPAFKDEKPVNLFTFAENPVPGDTLELSAEGKAALEKQMAAASSCSSGIDEEDDETLQLSDKDKQKIYLLQRMIETLTGKRLKFIMPKGIKLNNHPIDIQSVNTQANRQPTQAQAPVQRRQGWGVEYELHETHYEKQTLSFSAEGNVKTADGKEISFNLNLNMSREFASRTDVSFKAGDAVQVDPLVINYGSPAATLTNNKFSFDIDNDGGNENISFATGGSGFLAFDINKDGIINDGSELFGPQSGNGFNDLAKYDGDGNGWIDENDEIYDKLRIWSKDENGNDQLFAIGEKGIGAIYLGNVATAYDRKDINNQTLGSIAKTGIFLKENGSAGTIQHVDLAV